MPGSIHAPNAPKPVVTEWEKGECPTRISLAYMVPCQRDQDDGVQGLLQGGGQGG